MIELAVEAPVSLLPMTQPFTQLDFALAHRVLEDRDYAEWFKERNRARVPGTLPRALILDNSFHELGTALPILDLIEAAARVRADYVIAPDDLENPEWTLQQSLLLLEEIDPSLCAVVLSGNTHAQRKAFLEQTQEAGMLCLPYRKPRLEWFAALWTSIRASRIHLLGMSTLDELLAWAGLSSCEDFYFHSFSVDTSKPVKWGLLGESVAQKFEMGHSLRSAGISSKDLLTITEVSEAQVRAVEANLQFLQGLLTD